MILVTGPSTEGTLHFQYETTKISQSYSVSTHVTVAQTQPTILSLIPSDYPNSNAILIWVNSTDPVSSFYFTKIVSVFNSLFEQKYGPKHLRNIFLSQRL